MIGRRVRGHGGDLIGGRSDNTPWPGSRRPHLVPRRHGVVASAGEVVAVRQGRHGAAAPGSAGELQAKTPREELNRPASGTVSAGRMRIRASPTLNVVARHHRQGRRVPIVTISVSIHSRGVQNNGRSETPSENSLPSESRVLSLVTTRLFYASASTSASANRSCRGQSSPG
jgi:hypothetical protein